MPTYSDSEIISRNKSGKDKERAQKTDALFNQATQPPHEDDAAALTKLSALAGDDSTGGYATNDARNYARMRLNTIPGQAPMEYSEARDGGGLVGSIGGVLKKLAPMAGLIPGIGLPIGALAGAAGSALGGAMQGDKFDLGKTLMSGAASGLAAHANPFGGKDAVKDVLSAGPAESLSGGGATPMMSSGLTQKPGIGGQILNQFKTPEGTMDFGKLGQVAGAGMGMYEKNAQRKAQERLYTLKYNENQRQTQGAERAYAERAPIRNQALARLGQMRGASIFGGGAA